MYEQDHIRVEIIRVVSLAIKISFMDVPHNDETLVNSHMTNVNCELNKIV